MADPVAERVDEPAIDPDSDSPDKEKLEDLLAEARERFDYSCEYNTENHDRQKEDTRFVWVKGAQWDDEDSKAREGSGQPTLEASQLTQFIKQVVNDQRQNRPGILISPASGDASKQVADLLQGMIRHIEVDSQAEAAYDQAYEHAVTGGRGWIRVLTAYEEGETFDQKLLIKRVQDPLTVKEDPDYREPDGSDIGWCFITEKIGRKKFEKAYPDAQPLNWEGTSEYGEWFDGADDVIIADYYRRVKSSRTFVRMSDGMVGWLDELPKPLPPGIKVERSREVEDWKVEWYKVAGGQQILETLEWPGKTIPVVPVPGNEVYVDGKRQFQGLIRRARDTQKMYNYLISAAAERVALAPKAPWVMAEGQDEGRENLWKNANRTANSRLVYKPVTIGDQLAPAPQRQPPVQAEMGLLNHAEMCKGDIKSILGMYESSLGQKGNETSGRAILAREKQSDNATFDFVDNLSRAIALVGRICVECIGKVYDTPRVVGIVQPDDTKKTVAINQPGAAPGSPVDPFTGALQAIKINDVSQGKYAVTVKTGPSYATKRMESSESMIAFVQAVPQAMGVAADLIAKSQDWADAEVIGERLKFILPPEIRASIDAKEKGQMPPDPKLMQQMQQKDQQIQQMGQGLQQLQQLLAEAQKGTQAQMAKVAQDGDIARKKMAQDAELAHEKMESDSRLTIKKALIDASTKIFVAQFDTMGTMGADAGTMLTVEQISHIVAGATEQLMGGEGAIESTELPGMPEMGGFEGADGGMPPMMPPQPQEPMQPPQQPPMAPPGPPEGVM